VRGNPLHLTH